MGAPCIQHPFYDTFLAVYVYLAFHENHSYFLKVSVA